MIFRAIAGVITLFLGRELSFLFSGAMAALIGLRLTSFLPGSWPFWADYAFLAVLAILAAILTRINERAGYYVCGFLVGGFAACEYYAPGVPAIPLIPFIVGSVVGAVIVGILGEWGTILASSLIGVYLIDGVLPLTGMARILASAGIFLVGAITQVIIFQAQKHSER